jgi:benzoyl-CoA reductase subunit C
LRSNDYLGQDNIVENYYQNYGIRARELRENGQRIIGYLCALTPIEIIDAAGFVPFRIKGNTKGPITRADTQMETLVCALVRSAYDVTLKGQYNFIEGLVIPHACDSICRTYPIWKYTINVPYTHFINLPHGSDASCLQFFQAEIEMFRKSLGTFFRKEISDQDLIQSIRKYNIYRAKIRELFKLRKTDPPLVAGSEIIKILVAGMGIPVVEATNIVSNVIKEVKQRSQIGTNKPRLMIVGAEIDDASFMELIEVCGAYVVADDLCPGFREYADDVPTTSNPVDGLAERYLLKMKCSRTYLERKGTNTEYYEERFGHIGRRIKEFNVDGVILYLYKYCDPYGFEVPAIKSYLTSLGVPVFHLEGDYLLPDPGRLKTRIQAFIEQIINQR